MVNFFFIASVINFFFSAVWNPMWFQLPEDITDILEILVENNL